MLFVSPGVEQVFPRSQETWLIHKVVLYFANILNLECWSNDTMRLDLKRPKLSPPYNFWIFLSLILALSIAWRLWNIAGFSGKGFPEFKICQNVV